MITPDRQSTLDQWIDWLLSLHAEEIDLGLTRISQVAESLQVSKPTPIVISVAGTNGKGSSVAMLVAILKAAGYQVGAYTSPHIQLFNERIQINGISVDEGLIVEAFNKIEHVRSEIKLTYFEFSTLAALEIFNNAALDVVVLEVGLGGRLDAVNLVDADAALITSIDIDHIDWLGSDRSVIATEKAGIMRSHKPAVCSDAHPPVSLQNYAQKKSVPLCQFNRDFELHKDLAAWSLSWQKDSISQDKQLLCKNLPLPILKGAFQLQNAAGVVALLALMPELVKVDHKAVCTGLRAARHSGRLETFEQGGQQWLVDVAHNPQSANALAQYLSDQKSELESKKYTAIFSVLEDKDSEPMIRALSPFIQKWLIADLTIARATSIEKLRQLLIQSGVDEQSIVAQPSVAAAVATALQTPEEQVLVWGSFFTVAQAYNALDEADVTGGKSHG